MSWLLLSMGTYSNSSLMSAVEVLASILFIVCLTTKNRKIKKLKKKELKKFGTGKTRLKFENSNSKIVDKIEHSTPLDKS